MPGYAYNASAIGLGGVIKRGQLTTVVPTVASVCLSPSGGDGYVSYDNYYRDDISFARAECRVSGTEAPSLNGGQRRHITYSEVYLRDLKIFDRVRIAVMQATMTSTREIHGHLDRSLELKHDQTEFDIFVLFKGVEIDGSEVEPDVDSTFCARVTYDEYAQNVLNSGRILRILDTADQGITETEFDAIKADRRPFVASLVKEVKGTHYPSQNHKVKVGKFGKVKFAEVTVKPDRQRFNLLRLELDSDWSPSKQQLPTPAGGEGDVTVVAAAATAAAEAGDPIIGSGGSLSAASGGNNGIPVYP